MSFEKKLKQLEELTVKMRESDIPLEESINFFEKGMTLAKELDNKLKSFENRVEILLNDGEEDHIEDFK